MWHIIVDITPKQRTDIKHIALQEGIPVKELITNIILGAMYPSPTKVLPKEVEYGTMTEDTFSPGFVSI